MGVLASYASRGLARREGLVVLLLKLGRTRPLMDPHGGPQAGMIGYPQVKDADNDSINVIDVQSLKHHSIKWNPSRMIPRILP